MVPSKFSLGSFAHAVVAIFLGSIAAILVAVYGDSAVLWLALVLAVIGGIALKESIDVHQISNNIGIWTGWRTRIVEKARLRAKEMHDRETRKSDQTLVRLSEALGLNVIDATISDIFESLRRIVENSRKVERAEKARTEAEQTLGRFLTLVQRCLPSEKNPPKALDEYGPVLERIVRSRDEAVQTAREASQGKDGADARRQDAEAAKKSAEERTARLREILPLLATVLDQYDARLRGTLSVEIARVKLPRRQPRPLAGSAGEDEAMLLKLQEAANNLMPLIEHQAHLVQEAKDALKTAVLEAAQQSDNAGRVREESTALSAALQAVDDEARRFAEGSAKLFWSTQFMFCLMIALQRYTKLQKTAGPLVSACIASIGEEMEHIAAEAEARAKNSQPVTVSFSAGIRHYQMLANVLERLFEQSMRKAWHEAHEMLLGEIPQSFFEDSIAAYLPDLPEEARIDLSGRRGK